MFFVIDIIKTNKAKSKKRRRSDIKAIVNDYEFFSVFKSEKKIQLCRYML